ncbi:UPF0056 inner membrane protein [Planctomycetota bacterium]|nr:UPF0056 inner membrane protein [Planctomycetota bacterium]
MEFLSEVLRCFVPLFIIVSPFGAVPLFLPMTANDGLSRRRRTALFAAATAGVVLAGTAVVGEAVLAFFGISLDAFRIAGGALLFLYGMDLVQMKTPRMRTSQAEIQSGVEKEEVGIIPLGIPMLAGPGAVASVLVLRSGSSALLPLLVAIALLTATIAACLLAAAKLERWLTPVALGVLVRIEGLLLAAIAVQMVLTALRDLKALPV